MPSSDRPRLRAPGLLLTGVLTVLGQSSPARAQPRSNPPAESEPSAESRAGFDLAWDAPPGCPSRRIVRERIRALLGASADRAFGVHARGKIVRQNGRYQLTLTVAVGGVQRERLIESESCADLAGAAAVALGLLLRVEASPVPTTRDGDATDGRGVTPGADGSTGPDVPADDGTRKNGVPRAGQADPATSPTPPSAAPILPTPRVDTPPSSPPPGAPAPAESGSATWRPILRLPLLGVDWGPLPEPSLNAGLAFGFRVDRWQLTLGARLNLGQTSSADGPYGAELGRATAELRACYAARWPRFELAPCLVATLDRLSARGVGEQVASRTRHAAVFAAGAGATARWQLSDSFALVVSVGALLQTSRPRIVVEGWGQVDQLAPFALTANAGTEWIF